MAGNAYFCKNENDLFFLYKTRRLSQWLYVAISIDDIKDKESLVTWLNERPEAVRQNCAVFVAARSALRVLPIAVDGFQFSDWSRKREVTAIHCVRCALISSVAAKLSTDDMKKLGDYASDAYSDGDTIVDAAATSAYGTCDAANADASAKAVSGAAFATDAAGYAADAAAAVWRNVRADCSAWADHAAADVTCGIDIAPLIEGEFELTPDWPVVREKLLNDRDPKRVADWSFWIVWYDKILRDDPQDWVMLYEIAVSQEIDWKANPREVNAAIARIFEKHRLLREIADLKAQRDQLASFTASAEMRSHNMPPELVDADARVTQSIQIIWDTIDEAEEELREEKPEPSRLKKLGEVLLRATAEVIRYCGQKADIMVTEAAKKIGAAGGVAAAGLLASQTDAAKKIGNGLVEFAKLLGGG